MHRSANRILFAPRTATRVAFSWPRDKQRHCRVISFRAHVAAREMIRNFFGEFLPQNGVSSRLQRLARAVDSCASRVQNGETSYVTYAPCGMVYIFTWLFRCRRLNILINIQYCTQLWLRILKQNLRSSN